MKDVRVGLENKFRQGGYRLTASRGAILDIFRSGSKPLSVDDVYSAIKAKDKKVGLTTIYRAVDGLVRAGVLRKIVSSEGRAYYELLGERACDHHHHLVCRKCSSTAEYKDFTEEEVRLIGVIEKMVSKRHQFEIDDHQLCFIGICKQCRRTTKKERR